MESEAAESHGHGRRMLVVGNIDEPNFALVVTALEPGSAPGTVGVAGAGGSGDFAFSVEPHVAKQLAEMLVGAASAAKNGDQWDSLPVLSVDCTPPPRPAMSERVDVPVTLTADLCCRLCDGAGVREVTRNIGWGPNAGKFRAREICRCVVAVTGNEHLGIREEADHE